MTALSRVTLAPAGLSCLSLVLLIRTETSSICHLKTFTDVFECLYFCIVGREDQSEAGADIVGWCKVCGGSFPSLADCWSVMSSAAGSRIFGVFLGHRQALAE